MKRKQSKTSLFWAFIFIVGVVFIWLTQRAVPIMMDDEWYSTILSNETKLQSFADIIQAQIWHYNNWGGRTVAHVLAQSILLFTSASVADVLNTIVIILLAVLVCKVANARGIGFVTVTIGMLHGLNANWKMSMYWQTGACNYLYTMVLILLFLKVYLDILEHQKNEKMAGAMVIGTTILMSVLGLLVGWTNENMGPTIWILTVLIMLWIKHEHRTVGPWMISGSFFSLLGSVLMIVAPGNYVRSMQVAELEYGTLWQTFLRMYSICKGILEYLFPVIILTIVVLIINVCILENHVTKKDILLLIGAFLSWGAMVLSPHYPDRAAFGTMCLLLCVILSQVVAILRTKDTLVCRLAFVGGGLFIWLRGMYLLGEFLGISWGWIR